MKNDPFTSPPVTTSSTLSSAKPLAPRTSSLVELPTCPVCLERMDETTGLLTILCQHVFHCTCLQKWSGGGCPVCRYTHDDFSSRPRLIGKSGKKDSYGDYSKEEPIECETCHIEANLWQCLICGKIGCGRYEAKHAFSHYEETGHSFSMDMESKRVWDYAGDGYVHRIIQNSTDGLGGKLVELPGARHNETALDPFEEEEDNTSIPREKVEGLSLEYTHLLTSQLESQRVYFEEQVERAADKAAQAAAEASVALSTAQSTMSDLAALKSKYDDLARDAVPALEREKARLERRADKFEDMARKLEKEFREEKAINARLMERIQHLGSEVKELKLVKTDLEEQNRDLTFFISSSEKLRDAGEEIQEGTLSVPDLPTGGGGGKKKGKGKGRK
jgi:BRCA1-associated protein